MSTKPEDLQLIEDLQCSKIAAFRGDSKTVREFLNQGIAVNSVAPGNLTECTVLYAAMEKVKLEFIEELLMRSADPNVEAETSFFQYPILYAASGNRMDVVQLLLRHKADISKACNNGYNAAHYAIRVKNASLFKLLLEAKADCDKTYDRSRVGCDGAGPSVRAYLSARSGPEYAPLHDIFRQHQENERRQAEASAQAGSESSSAAASSPKAEKPGSL